MNLTRLHCDPVVKKLKIAWPWDTPVCDPWNANQSIIVLLLSKFLPLCTRQALKRLVVTSSIQMKAKSWTPDVLFPWLIEANTLTGVPSPENLLLNDTYWQVRSPFLTCMSILPLWTPKMAERAFFKNQNWQKCECCVEGITLKIEGSKKNPIITSKHWNGENVRVENSVFFQLLSKTLD